MRISSSIVFVGGALVTVLACSSSESTIAGTAPDGGTTSSSGGGSSSGDDGGGSSSGTTSSGGSSGTPDAAVEWVKNETFTTQVDGDDRTYIVSVPVDYAASKSYPLYVWLHGDPGNAQSAAGFKLDRATKNEALIAYPGARSGSWDHTAVYQDNADTNLIFTMIDEIKAKYSIDAGRILLGGWSAGGFMAGQMACRYSGSFKAIAIEAGGAPFDPNGGPNPTCDGASIATIVTHGGMDTTVGTTSGFYAAEYWEDKNGCNGSKAASGTPLCEDYAGCPAGKPVRYCSDPNWGHGILNNAFDLEWAWFKALP